MAQIQSIMKSSYILPQKEVDAQNYYYFYNTFNQAELNILENGLTKLSFEKAVTVGGGGDDIRSSQIKWIPQHPQFEWLYFKMMNLALEANQNLWDFDLHTINDNIQYTEYYASQNGHYDWHQDVGPNNLSQRKLSIVIQLNDDYEGGELQIWQGGQSYQTLPKQKGFTTCFPSYMMHRVLPVTEGIRKSLVLWIGGGRYR